MTVVGASLTVNVTYTARILVLNCVRLLASVASSIATSESHTFLKRLDDRVTLDNDRGVVPRLGTFEARLFEY